MPAFTVLKTIDPLEVVVPKPVDMEYAPPVLSELSPENCFMSPPAYLVPAPIEIEMSPPLPPVAAPVCSRNAPEVPELVVPEENDKYPLVPASPASNDFKTIFPLDDADPYPADTETAPPDC